MESSTVGLEVSDILAELRRRLVWCAVDVVRFAIIAEKLTQGAPSSGEKNATYKALMEAVRFRDLTWQQASQSGHVPMLELQFEIMRKCAAGFG